MFGPDLLVAPVVEAGARERAVHLPHGSTGSTPRPGRNTRGAGRCPSPRHWSAYPSSSAPGHLSPGRRCTDVRVQWGEAVRLRG
ncbi:hypothetical protein [Streptomyces sp. NPDC012510]|uniref:hypothetical protein n=1 Tax=Streptomyces sp. NPDC012510 TaxID=3364838 RepID=UPI0036ED9199